MKNTLLKYTNEQIFKKLFEIYPEQKKCKKGYENMINKLRKMKPIQSDYTLITNSKYSIYGKKEGDETSWGLSFMRWEEWLGCKMNKGGLIPLCHCLWEMTYHGFTQQKTQGLKRSLLSRIKDIKLSGLQPKRK